MTEPKPLSPTMESALADITKAGGIVERKPGGYWVLPGAVWHGSGWTPAHWGTTTIQALVDRGRLSYSKHQTNSRGEFPVEAKVTP